MLKEWSCSSISLPMCRSALRRAVSVAPWGLVLSFLSVQRVAADARNHHARWVPRRHGGDPSWYDGIEGVKVLFPGDDVQAVADAIFSEQEHGQFNDRRYALLLTPGEYGQDVNIKLAYYTSVLGVGRHPADVRFGSVTSLNGDVDYACQNFWRSVEGVTLTAPQITWAVSQSCPIRRSVVAGDLYLSDAGGWSSGGFLADSEVRGRIDTGSQQQWFFRDVTLGPQGIECPGGWNFVFVGTRGLDGHLERCEGDTPGKVTVVARTPRVAEKPYLVMDQDESGVAWRIYVPPFRINDEPGSNADAPISDASVAESAHGALAGQGLVQDRGAETAERRGHNDSYAHSGQQSHAHGGHSGHQSHAHGGHSGHQSHAHGGHGSPHAHSGMAAGQLLDLQYEVFVARPGDSAEYISEGIAGMRGLLLTPGVYRLDAPIRVTEHGFVVLGIGYPTLITVSGGPAIHVLHGLKGVRLAGLLLEAGTVLSSQAGTGPVLLWGSKLLHDASRNKEGHDHAKLKKDKRKEQHKERKGKKRHNKGFRKKGKKEEEESHTTKVDTMKEMEPSGVISDVFVRVGSFKYQGCRPVRADSMVEINSDDVVLDNMWLWHADHDDCAQGPDGYVSDMSYSGHGLIVNGDRVTSYGLAVEHVVGGHAVVWNGEDGETYFFQCELPYRTSEFTREGHAGYAVGPHVRRHSANGLGVYIVGEMYARSACVLPPNASAQNIITVVIGSRVGRFEGSACVLDPSGGVSCIPPESCDSHNRCYLSAVPSVSPTFL